MSDRIEKLTLVMSATQEIVKLEFVSDEELIKLYNSCAHRAASRRFHNIGFDGLFLHLVMVASQIQRTKGYKESTPEVRELLTMMGLYHDFFTKVENLEYKGVPFTKRTRALLTFEPVRLRFKTIVTALFTTMCGDDNLKQCELPSFLENYVFAWQFRHHGLIDGQMPEGVSARFAYYLMEVARVDAYDAAFSTGIQGQSMIAII